MTPEQEERAEALKAAREALAYITPGQGFGAGRGVTPPEVGDLLTVAAWIVTGGIPGRLYIPSPDNQED